MQDFIDDIIRTGIRFGFLLIPMVFMVIFLLLLEGVLPFSKMKGMTPLTQDLGFLLSWQSFFERITGLQFNLIDILLPLTGRSAR
jgi:hypothetical protein